MPTARRGWKKYLINTAFVAGFFDQGLQLFDVGQAVAIADRFGFGQCICPRMHGGCAGAGRAVPCLA